MKKNNLKRFLASLLAVLMLSQVTGVAPGVFALDETGTTEPTESTEPVAPEFKGNTGEVLIKSDYDSGKILDALAKAFLANYSELTKEQIAAINWTYKYAVKGTYIKLNVSWPTYDTDEAREAEVPVLAGYTYIDKNYVYGTTITGKDKTAEATYVYPALKDVVDGAYELYANGKSVGTINKVSKYSTTLVLKESATITYNKDAAAEKSAIVANLVDYTNSVIPTGTTADNFTVEVQKTTLGVKHWKDIPDEKLDAGDGYTIRVSYKGNDDYKASASQTATVNVTKAPVSISMKAVNTLYAGNEIDTATFYTVSPEDKEINVYIFFVGINSNGDTCVNLKLTPSQEKIIDVITDIQKAFGVDEDNTLYAKLRAGMTVGEFKEILAFVLDKADNIITEKILDLAGIDINALRDLVKALDLITGITDDTVLAIGTPAHAGVYQAFAVSPETDNYEQGMGTGTLVILKNWKNIKLAKNPLFDANNNTITAKNNTITVSQAKEIANSVCILTKDGESLNSASAGSIHYWFTGVNKIYAKSVMPTAPGRYIVTASVRGGDFFAFPKTFSFTIVADPTPEVTPEA